MRRNNNRPHKKSNQQDTTADTKYHLLRKLPKSGTFDTFFNLACSRDSLRFVVDLKIVNRGVGWDDDLFLVIRSRQLGMITNRQLLTVDYVFFIVVIKALISATSGRDWRFLATGIWPLPQDVGQRGVARDKNETLVFVVGSSCQEPKINVLW